jgi:hypothetical protein
VNFDDKKKKKQRQRQRQRQENVKGNRELKRKDFPLPVGANTMHRLYFLPTSSKIPVSSILRCVAKCFALLFVWVRSVVVRSQWTNSVPAQAVLAHDRRRDALLSYAAAVGAVTAVAATSRSAAAAAVAAAS